MTRRRWFALVPCALAAALAVSLTDPTVDAQTRPRLQTLIEALTAAITTANGDTEPDPVFANAAPQSPSNLRLETIGGVPTLRWDAPTTGDPVTEYIIDIYDRPRNSQPQPRTPVSARTFSNATSLAITQAVPPGNYCLEVRALNGDGASAPSNNELCGTIPGPGGCTLPGAPTLNQSSPNGTSLPLTWTAVPGATSYIVHLGVVAGQALVSLPANGTSFTVNGIPPGTSGFAWIRAVNACGASQQVSNVLQFVVAGGGGPNPGPNPPTGNREPDPPPGQRIPIPGYAAGIILQMGNQFHGELLNSCVEHGGNNQWLFRTVQALRNVSTRWGLNWKRGNRGDMSQDIIDFHHGPGPDEDSTDVYIFDVIGGHCGNNPDAQMTDVTQATRDAGTIGRWTLAGRQFNP
jgi:hypothetical protein